MMVKKRSLVEEYEEYRKCWTNAHGVQIDMIPHHYAQQEPYQYTGTRLRKTLSKGIAGCGFQSFNKEINYCVPYHDGSLCMIKDHIPLLIKDILMKHRGYNWLIPCIIIQLVVDDH